MILLFWREEEEPEFRFFPLHTPIFLERLRLRLTVGPV